MAGQIGENTSRSRATKMQTNFPHAGSSPHRPQAHRPPITHIPVYRHLSAFDAIQAWRLLSLPDQLMLFGTATTAHPGEREEDQQEESG